MRLAFSVIAALFINAISAQSPELEKLVSSCKRYQAYPDSLIKYGNQMLTLGSTEAQYEGNFAIGLGHYRQGNYTQAIERYKNALSLSNALNDSQKGFLVKRNIAISFRNQGKPEIALLYLDTLETEASAASDSLALSTTFNTRGAIYRQLGDYAKASESLKSAFLLTPPMAYSRRANIALNLGVLYGSKQQFALSERWFRQTLALGKKAGNNIMLARAYNNLGYSKSQQNQADSSIYFYKNALIIYRAQQNVQPLLLGYRNMAESHLSAGELNRATQYLDSANSLLKKEDVVSTAILNGLHAELALAKGNPKKAALYVDSAIVASKQNRETDRLIANYRLKAKVLEKLGKNSEALYAERKAQGLVDSIQYFKDMSIIQSAAGQVELTQKEEEAQQLKASESFWRSTLFLSALIGVALFFLSVYFFRRNNRKKQLLHVREEEIEALNTRMEEAQNDTLSDKNILLKSKAFITLDKLMYIETDGHYLNFYLEEGKEMDRNSLKNILEQLPEKHFIQIHRSYLVNLNYVRAIYAEKLLLKNGTELKVSRTFKQELKLRWANNN